jgi:hypothetical protein
MRLIEWTFSDPRCQGVTAIGVQSVTETPERVSAKLGMQLVQRHEGRSDWLVDADRSSDRVG